MIPLLSIITLIFVDGSNETEVQLAARDLPHDFSRLTQPGSQQASIISEQFSSDRTLAVSKYRRRTIAAARYSTCWEETEW